MRPIARGPEVKFTARTPSALWLDRRLVCLSMAGLAAEPKIAARDVNRRGDKIFYRGLAMWNSVADAMERSPRAEVRPQSLAAGSPTPCSLESYYLRACRSERDHRLGIERDFLPLNVVRAICPARLPPSRCAVDLSPHQPMGSPPVIGLTGRSILKRRMTIRCTTRRRRIPAPCSSFFHPWQISTEELLHFVFSRDRPRNHAAAPSSAQFIVNAGMGPLRRWQHGTPRA